MRNKKLKKAYEEGTTHDTTKEGMKLKKVNSKICIMEHDQGKVVVKKCRFV
jgi:hypothetical protein